MKLLMPFGIAKLGIDVICIRIDNTSGTWRQMALLPSSIYVYIDSYRGCHIHQKNPSKYEYIISKFHLRGPLQLSI
jgi:hypothetical protein